MGKSPTARQKRVAELIIENPTLDEPLNSGELVENSGYGVSMKKNPHVVLKSKGVQDALEEFGFTEDNAKKVVSEILLDPKQKGETRINAAKEVFKVRGSYAPEKSVSLSLDVSSEKKNLSNDAIARFLNGNR